jgi:NAD(P)-dependent dehydrogenase (short-subunit alcohol dehydrogenase family)
MAGMLVGKTAVVTGAANGLGRAIAECLAVQGATVVGLDIEHCPDTADAVRMVHGSVAEENDVRRAIEIAIELGHGLDIMVNNAGIQIEKDLMSTTVEEFDRIVAINLRGVFIGTREAARVMSSGASIINVGSALGTTGDPLLTAYCATKGGVVNFSRAAAANLGRRGIRVNCLCPGAVATPLMTRMWDMAPDPAAARAEMEAAYPLGRIVEPDEVGKVAVFLASGLASAVHGAVVAVDCGLTAANPEYASVIGLGTSESTPL